MSASHGGVGVIIRRMVVELAAVDIEDVLVVLRQLSKGLAQSLPLGCLAVAHILFNPSLDQRGMVSSAAALHGGAGVWKGYLAVGRTLHEDDRNVSMAVRADVLHQWLQAP